MDIHGTIKGRVIRKPLLILFFVCGLTQFSLHAQIIPDSIGAKDTVRIPSNEIADTLSGIPGKSAYGELLNDDPAYNPRYPAWIPAARVVSADAFNWVLARYVFKFDWARISPSTWKQNLKGPWVWDKDRFGVNFIGHPHSGSNYFNVARSNGYSYFQCLPYTIGGSLVWELFGEKDPPSKNDIINTPISGMFLGEILYRISSNILDDRTRGGNRVFREILAGLINPTRALNRLTQGKMFRVTKTEVYQKEPLNITLSAGVHKVNSENHFGAGNTNALLNLQLDYGDPFEVRHRKPFDIFRLKLESRYGDDKRIIDNVVGHGELFGKNIVKGRQGIFLGAFQHFDYWNNDIFELGSLGFGPGLLSRIDMGTNTKLYSGLHIAVVPLAGNNTRSVPDTSVLRDYNFGGGFQGRIEETLHLGKWLSLGMTAYYYWVYEYEGLKGKSRVGIIKPSIRFRLFNNTSLGFEHHVYYHNRFVKDIPDLHQVRTEQKIFLQFYFEDPKRRGRYQ
jgi:hypothetical protein